MESLIAESDEIYHLAAAVGLKPILEHGIKAIKSNVNGAEIVLRLANKDKKKVMFASSSEVYGLWQKHAGIKATAEALANGGLRSKLLNEVNILAR
jgi:UDP-glucose 4-epimerase